jgi:hypothetical protein
MDILTILGQVGPLILATATAFMAYFTYLVVKEGRKQDNVRFLEKSLEEFYEPLINTLRNGPYYGIMDKDLSEVIRIFISKRYLCSAQLANILPYTVTDVFSGTPVSSIDKGTVYTFTKEEDFDKWRHAADKIWEEYLEKIEEYSKSVGTTIDISKFSKPSWASLKLKK